METLSINFLIKDSPTAVAILDKDLRFISYSDEWVNQFCLTNAIIKSKKFTDVLLNTPIPLLKDLEHSLTGEKNINPGAKYILDDGGIQWLKWRIKPWKNHDDKIGGVIIVLEDITAEQREKALLLKAEVVARIGGWEVDLLKNTLYWSSMTKTIHEVSPDYVPNLEEGINFYKEGESREKITRLVNLAITEGKPWDTELIIVTTKGNELWVRAKGETEMINGKCARIFGTFQDIDEKKKTELKYKEVTERLKVATDTANIGIWEYDLINNTLVWDANMYKLYGVKETNFTGVYDAWETVVHPDDKERGRAEIAQAVAGEKEFDTEFRVNRPNGAIRNIRAIASTERNANGKAVKMIGANWDITELKRTRLKLERSQESFNHTFENLVAGMALVGLDGKWISVNKGLCDSFGYTQEEFLNITWQEITHPEDLDSDLELLQQVLDGNITTYQFEKRFYHKDGHILYTLLTVTAANDEDGQLSHLISQVLNITSRIEAEKRLKTLVDVTKGQNDSLLNFAHIVSHNLRSHSTNLSMLTKFLKDEESVEERENLNVMLSNATNGLSETIQHLNDVVQVRTGALEKMQSVSLLNVVNNVEKSIEGLLKEKDATTNISIQKSHFVMAVPAYLESIILNLYTNSLKYSSPKRKPVISVSSSSKNNYIQIEFKDNGQGIDLERHGSKVFGMYKTFHAHKEAKGIGLFITKNQIESMDGSISLKSKVDKGTTFFIKLKKR
ncbi:PAS domain S-box protein [Maribacter sp. R77961]|uniref:PAS domain S-box protein n=1 Tax=Maribacter sp. R77961 TaxID=3093871 RepID=UPI0037CBA907